MGLWDRVRSVLPFAPPPLPIEGELVAEGNAPSQQRAWLERALVSGDLGMTAVSMSGAQPPQRKGNIEVMRSYATGPWLRGAVGRISTSVASTKWRVYAAPKAGQERLPRRVAFEDIWRRGIRIDRAPDELLDLRGQDRLHLVREMVREGNLVEVTRHPWCELMAMPNAAMTGRVARQVTIASYDLVGDAAWVLGGDTGSDPSEGQKPGTTTATVPTKAWPIPGVWIQRRPTLAEPWWVVQIGAGSASANATVWNVPWDALLLFNDPDPLNPYGRGIGTGFSLGDEVDIDEGAAKTVSGFFHNNAMPAAMVAIKGAKRDVLERAKREWNNKFQGFKKSWNMHFTGGEIQVERMDTTFKEMALVQLRDAQRKTFQQVFGVPPEIMGDNSSSSWATSSAADLIMGKEVKLPRLEMMREQFQRLANYFDSRLVVEFDNPIPADKENRREVMKSFPSYFRVDEVRALADEEPIGDESGQGFVVDGVWYGSLGKLAPEPTPQDLVAGIISIDERRLQLRLPARGHDELAAVQPDDEEDDGADATVTPPVTEVKPADTALNGAQISSLVQIIDAVAAGDLPKETAKAVMKASFPMLDDAEINAMLDPIDEGSKPATPAPFDGGDGGEGVDDAALEEAGARHVIRRLEQLERQMRARLKDRPRRDTEHLTPDQIRKICAAADQTVLYDAMLPETRALVNEWGQASLNAMGSDETFDEHSPSVRKHLRELGTERCSDINATTRKRLRDAIHAAEREYHDGDDDGVEENARAGAAKTFEDVLTEAIALVFDDARADNIGFSETTNSAGFATNEAQHQTELEVDKEWISAGDADVRDTHQELDGTIIPIDENFHSSSGASGPHPGALGTPSEDANCRCVLGTVIVESDDDDDRARRVRGYAVGRRTLSSGTNAAARKKAANEAHEELKAYDAKMARAVKHGFDQQHVRVLAALKDALG